MSTRYQGHCGFCGQDLYDLDFDPSKEAKTEAYRSHASICPERGKSTLDGYQMAADQTAIYRQAIEALLRPIKAVLYATVVTATPAEKKAMDEALAAFGKVRNTLYLWYPVLGLCGEAGEIANKVKKVLRDGAKIDYKDLQHETGDVLWYDAVLSTELVAPLSGIAEMNLEKLAERKAKDTLKGSGDNR